MNVRVVCWWVFVSFHIEGGEVVQCVEGEHFLMLGQLVEQKWLPADVKILYMPWHVCVKTRCTSAEDKTGTQVHTCLTSNVLVA